MATECPGGDWKDRRRTCEHGFYVAHIVERNWTANIVVSSEHAGLRPYFKQLEAELLHALARIDDPRMVMKYLDSLVTTSRVWLKAREVYASRR